MDSSFKEPSGRRSELDAAGSDGPSDDGFEVEVSESTDRAAAIVSDEGEDDVLQVAGSDDEVSRQLSRSRHREEAPGRPRAAPVTAGPVADSNASVDYPLLEDDYEEEQRRSSGRRGPSDRFDREGRETSPRERRLTPNRPDSVDIPIEEVLETGSGRVISSAPIDLSPLSDEPADAAPDPLKSLERALGGPELSDPESAARASGNRGPGNLEFGGVDSGGLLAGDSGGWAAAAAALSGTDAPSSRRAGAALSGGPQAPGRRLQTLSLSDADIEELEESEGQPEPGEPFSADAGWTMPSLDRAGDRRGESRVGVAESDGDAWAAPLVPAPAVGGSDRGPEPGTTPARSEHQVVGQGREQGAGHLAGAGSRGGMRPRPLTNRDPSDSGEIIDDELIEEIEESQRVTSLASRAHRPAAVPLPQLDPDSTLDLDGDEDVEELPADPRGRLGGPGEAGVSAAAAAPAVAPPAPAQPPVQAKPKPPPAPSATRAAAAAAAAAAADPSQARPRRRRGKPWFEDIFDEDYLRTLPFLTPQATQMEAQFVMDALAISAGTQVLDVGCGYGRHAMELAARGFHVVGLDSSLPLLLRGADEAQRRGLTINFVHGDMRDMAFDAQFDGAYCLFSTFGYFDDETNKKTAQNICHALKPGARCVFEVLNRDYIIAELPLRVWWEGDGCVVLEEVDFNYFSSRLMSNRSVVFDDGRQLEQEISIRSFGLHELGKLLHSAGFRVVEVSGNMITKGRFFGAQSRDIVVIAERRIEKPGSPSETGGRIP